MSFPAAFELAVGAHDTRLACAHKRKREADERLRRERVKPPSEAFPFHDPEAVLNAALEGVSAVTGAPSPAFDLNSDPRLVHAWARDAAIAFGNERLQAGRTTERQAAEPRMTPQVAMEAFELFTKLNSLLSAPTGKLMTSVRGRTHEHTGAQ